MIDKRFIAFDLNERNETNSRGNETQISNWVNPILILIALYKLLVYYKLFLKLNYFLQSIKLFMI